MRILIVNHRDFKNPRAGGLEDVVLQSCKRWATWGEEVELLCAGWEGAPREEVLEGVRVRRGPNEYVFNWWAPWKIRALGPHRYDVILEYISKVPCFIPAVVARVPVAVMVPHLFGKTAFAELSWPLAAYTYALEQPIPRVYRQSRFWALSQTTADDLAERGVAREQMEVIYPGFNSDLLRSEPGLTKTPFPSLIYVGRLKKYKRVDLVIAATARLRERFPTVRLFIVGTGDNESALRQQVHELGLEAAVEFTGFVTEARKKELLAAAWVGAQTSTIEGWGLGVIEAGACGTPTVASDSRGLRDSVRAGETGILVPHGDLAGLVNQFSRVLSDANFRTQLGAAARRWAEKFSWEEMAKSALEFVRRAAKKT